MNGYGYPATWGLAQLVTGAWSDRVGRKWLIASGMWLQAIGIVVIVLSGGFARWLPRCPVCHAVHARRSRHQAAARAREH